MLRSLRQPKWTVAAAFVVAVSAVFIRLGFWQLDRLEQRQMLNAVGEERIEAEPLNLATLLAEAEGDLESLQYRRVFVMGSYDPSGEVLIRSRVYLGQAGFHVVTPLLADEGWAVLVNRGWVPLSMGTPPVDARPETGRQRVEGWVQLSQTRPALGPEDLPGDQMIFNRLDVGRIGEQMDHDVASVYILALGEEDELPAEVELPDFEDEGSHLAYAIQWFGFAAVALIGFYFLLRRKGGQET
ncbi:MAG TPA: SURF1 family protein [Acidimicrobiia bacterium]